MGHARRGGWGATVAEEVDGRKGDIGAVATVPPAVNRAGSSGGSHSRAKGHWGSAAPRGGRVADHERTDEGWIDTQVRFNWGLTVRKKSERVLKLLEKGPLLKKGRDRAQKVTHGIQGFGSFNHRWSSTTSTCEDHYARSNSHYEDFNVTEDNSNSLVELDAHANNKYVNAVVESKPLLPGHEDEPKVEDQKEEHPFSSMEHEK
ncbi:hypothetical protein J5N97_017060 [Dioscorea zingiberensis]|uniref:Uncharacterized protein n=1 Tax=Dioscorea zingiberensis TaxID=325984 RepID=A0A9D5CL18_9LILI|nr:hypothetical protein J5N97_017060 [Dioscorea zingiberensis]